MDRICAWLQIVRPPIIFIGMWGAIGGAMVMGARTDAIFWATMAMWGVLWGGIMVHNDYTDYRSDVVNKPWKPLPRGAIGLKSAHYVGMSMMTLPLAAIFVANLYRSTAHAVAATFWAFTLWLVGVLYNYRGKDWGVLGHMLVAWGVAIIPFYGAVVARPLQGMAVFFPVFVGVFIGEIGREIIVCTQDYEGDKKQGWRTYPVRVGPESAMRVVPFYYVGYFILLAPRLAFPEFFSDIYLVDVLVFIAALYTLWALNYRKFKSEKNKKKLQNAFEYYTRTWTRIFIIIFESLLVLEGMIDLRLF